MMNWMKGRLNLNWLVFQLLSTHHSGLERLVRNWRFLLVFLACQVSTWKAKSIWLFRIMSIPTTFPLFRVLTSETLGRKLPVIRYCCDKVHRYLWTGPYVAPFFFKMLAPPFFFLLNIDFFSYKQHISTLYVSLYDIYTINTIKQ